MHAAGGDVELGRTFFGSVRITITTARGEHQSGCDVCGGGTGTGRSRRPYTGVTSCTLPFGSRMNVLPFSHYTVQPGDFALPDHQLRDDAALTWHDLCNDPAQRGTRTATRTRRCGRRRPVELITPLASTTATTIHNAAHAVGDGGRARGDGARLRDGDRSAGEPAADGERDDRLVPERRRARVLRRSNSGTIGRWTRAGRSTRPAFAFTVSCGRASARSRRTTRVMRPTTASDGPCEPLQVVDANIQITPATATNAVGTNHTLTLSHQRQRRQRFVNAPDGTICTVNDHLAGRARRRRRTACTTVGATRLL